MQVESNQPIVVAKPPPMVHPFPHHYRVVSSAEPDGEVALGSARLESLGVLPPAEFGGPGDHWSPETLLVGAISSCFVLTFRAIARARRIPWHSLDCAVEGVLEREQGNSRFTDYTVRACLRVPAGTDLAAADQALHKAEQGCLITNSLTGRCRLETRIDQAD
jgi:organic hydroperoxide reductase OsmC/OhrA